MEALDPTTIESLEEAQKLIGKLQNRLYKAENCLDDLSRAMEIAQFTKQFHLTEVFMKDAAELLQDRITVPMPEQSDATYTVIEGEIDKGTFDQLGNVLAKNGTVVSAPTTIGIDANLNVVGNTVRRAPGEQDA